MQNVKNYIRGTFVDAIAQRQLATRDVINPATLDSLGRVPLCGDLEIDAAVKAAKDAFHIWKKTPVVSRIQPLFKLKSLLERDQDEIARIIVQEHGKTLVEAMGDLKRGLQNVETACSLPIMQMGECQEHIAADIDAYSTREPAGVFAAITPFNFPAMVPFWFWPYAVAAGNTFVLKPSETVPMTQMKIFELIDQCGFPPGVINMVHGAKDAVNAILKHPDIRGVSFVGSTPVAKYIYTTAAAHGKRVQALGGAKNFLVMMPDAPKDKAIAAMVDSCLGCAGERCLAGSVLIGVGEAYQALKTGVLEYVSKVKVGNGLDAGTTMGPVISAEAKARIMGDIETAIQEGAELLVDGRKGLPTGLKGHFLGPSVFDKVKPGTSLATKEIFGPVIGLMSCNNLEEAIEVVNASPYGNTTSIFTSSGGAARKFSQSVAPSMIGVNVGVPAPMSFFSFGGSKDSFFGDVKAQGWSSIEFYTEKKMSMVRWFAESSSASTSPHWGS